MGVCLSVCHEFSETLSDVTCQLLWTDDTVTSNHGTIMACMDKLTRNGTY